MKSLLLAVLAATLSACSFWSSPPHSEYYIVFFDPAGATLSPEGRAALAKAARDAKGGEPRAVAVKGYLSADGNAHELSAQRMQVVEQGLLDGGVPKALVQLTPETTDPASFGRLGNGVVVQVERGEGPAPNNPEGEASSQPEVAAPSQPESTD